MVIQRTDKVVIRSGNSKDRQSGNSKEDKVVIRSSNSKEDIQYNDQNEKNKTQTIVEKILCINFKSHVLGENDILYLP